MIGPEGIAAHHPERVLAEMGDHFADAAACIKNFVFFGKRDSRRLTFGQMGFQDMPQIMQVDDNIRHAVGLEMVKGAVNQGPAADLDHGFGAVMRIRAQPPAEACREDECFFRFKGQCRKAFPASSLTVLMRVSGAFRLSW